MVPGLVFLSFPGEVHLIRGVRNNVCPLYWMSPGPGKVPQIRGNMVHFPCGFPAVPLCKPSVVPCSVWTIGGKCTK